MRERGSSGAWATLRALEEEEQNIADNNAENNTANSAKNNNNAEKTTHSEAAHTSSFLLCYRCSQPYMRYYPCTGMYRTKKATGVLRVSHKSTEKWRQCLLSKSGRARSYRSNFRRTNQSYRCSAD